MSWLDDFTAHAQTQLGSREREALWMRGVSDEQIELFKLGYLNRALPEGLPKEFIRFSNGGQRLDDVFVLPLTNILGQIKGVQFRHVVPTMKGYMTYYHDRDESVYFGLGQAIPKMWETNQVFMVEGAFDVFPIQRVFPNTFAALTLGTSEALARLVRRFAKEVWLAYDNDRDGQRACLDFQKDYSDLFDVKILTIPKVRIEADKTSKDPSDLWVAWGDTKLAEYLTKQVNPYMKMEMNHGKSL